MFGSSTRQMQALIEQRAIEQEKQMVSDRYAEIERRQEEQQRRIEKLEKAVYGSSSVRHPDAGDCPDRN